MKSYRRCFRVWAGIFSLTALLTGCVKVGPDYVRPRTSVAVAWQEISDERVRTDPAEYRAWWEAFHDPVLNQVIERAYRENISLKVAGVRVLEARAQLGVAVGGFYPQTQQVVGSLALNRSSESSLQAAGSSLSTSSSQFSYWQDSIGLSATWEIDFWGQLVRAIESADAGLLGAVANYDAALVSLTADAAASYIQLRNIEKRLEIAHQNVETQKESLKIAEARFEGGITSERDVEQARTILFNTQATIPTLQAQQQQARNALAVLLGAAPDGLGDLFDNAADIPSPPPHVAVGIPADLLRRRPDVRSAELQAMAQCAQIGVAKADLFPTFSLTGSFGFLSTDISRFSLSDTFNWKSRAGAIGPSLQWNILNYGRLTNNVRVQDARFQALLLTYQNTVIKAQQEVEDALIAFLRSQENAELLARSAVAAKHSVELATVQYQQGITDFTTVLTAQVSLLSTQDNFANALASIGLNLVRLYRALGGGWEIRIGKDLVSPEIQEIMARRTNWGRLLAPGGYMPANSEPRPTVRPPDW